MKCNIPAADLAQKLNDTVCRYKSEPVYVRVEKSKLHLFKIDSTGAALAVIKADDPDFDVAGPPLGYIQLGRKVQYLTRFPLRRTKQGLDVRAIRSKDLAGESLGLSKLNVFSPSFKNMLQGEYPDLGDALKSLRADYAQNNRCNSEIAVTRNIAMSINEIGVINVYYKNNLVGYIQPDKFTVHVSNSEWSWVISKFLSHELTWEVD